MRLSGKRILILCGPDYEDMELHYPRYRLMEEGAEVVVAGIGEATYKGKKGYPIDRGRPGIRPRCARLRRRRHPRRVRAGPHASLRGTPFTRARDTRGGEDGCGDLPRPLGGDLGRDPERASA